MNQSSPADALWRTASYEVNQLTFKRNRNGGNLPQQQDPRYVQQNQPQLQQQYIQQNQMQYQPPQQQMMYQQQVRMEIK